MIDTEILDLCLKVDKVFSDEKKKTYGWNNGVVSFYTENGEYYVTPFCFDVKDYLEKQGYVDSGLPVAYEYSWEYVYDPKNGVIDGYAPGETVYLGGPVNKSEAKKWFDLCRIASARNEEIRNNKTK